MTSPTNSTEEAKSKKPASISGPVIMGIGIGNLVVEIVRPFNKVEPEIAYCAAYVAIIALGWWLNKTNKQANS